MLKLIGCLIVNIVGAVHTMDVLLTCMKVIAPIDHALY